MSKGWQFLCRRNCCWKNAESNKRRGNYRTVTAADTLSLSLSLTLTHTLVLHTTHTMEKRTKKKRKVIEKNKC